MMQALATLDAPAGQRIRHSLPVATLGATDGDGHKLAPGLQIAAGSAHYPFGTRGSKQKLDLRFYLAFPVDVKRR